MSENKHIDDPGSEQELTSQPPPEKLPAEGLGRERTATDPDRLQGETYRRRA